MRTPEETEKLLENVSEDEMKLLGHLIESDVDREDMASILTGVLLMSFHGNHTHAKSYFYHMAKQTKLSRKEAEAYDKWKEEKEKPSS